MLCTKSPRLLQCIQKAYKEKDKQDKKSTKRVKRGPLSCRLPEPPRSFVAGPVAPGHPSYTAAQTGRNQWKFEGPPGRQTAGKATIGPSPILCRPQTSVTSSKQLNKTTQHSDSGQGESFEKTVWRNHRPPECTGALYCFAPMGQQCPWLYA